MPAHKIAPEKVAIFALVLSKGGTIKEAEIKSGISHATAMRQMKNPLSEITLALADLNIARGKIPSEDKYSDDAKKALTDFGFFRQYFFARSTSPWAEEAAYKIVELLESPREEYLVINIAPGVGKSTMFTHDLPAWLLARNRDQSVMIGSATQDLADQYVNRLRRTFERTRPERADRRLEELGIAVDAKSTLPLSYGRFRTMKGTWSKTAFDIEQEEGEVRGEKEYSVAAFGMDSGYLGGRYDFVIWDDLVTNATVRTEGARLKLITDWDGQAETRLEPEGLLVLQGQRLNPNDLYRYCLDQKEYQELDVVSSDEVVPKRYHHITYKAHYDDRCEGDHSREAKAYPEGCLLDPRRLDWRKLMNFKLKNESGFRTVYQQEDVSMGDNLVQPVWIDGGVDSKTGTILPGCWDEDRSAGFVPPGLEGVSVITADPSPTAYWAVNWWIYNPITKFQHLIDMKREPMTASDFLDFNPESGKFTGLLEQWWQEAKDQGRPIKYLIVEENAAQRFMLQYNHFKRWQSLRQVIVKPHTTARNKSNAEFGVQTLATYYRHGMVRLPGNKWDGSKQLVGQLVKEVTEWPNGITDDCVMAHWFLVWNAQSLFSSVNLEPIKVAVPSWVEGMGF